MVNFERLFGTTLTTSAGTAYWEIRSGTCMTGDNWQPALLGTDSASQTAMTDGLDLGITDEIAVAVSGLTGITLSGGAGGMTYGLSVIPIDNADGTSFITNTDGTDSINVQPGTSDNTFFSSTDGNAFPGMPFFEPASNEIESPADFSMGVTGVVTASVPEPSTLVLEGSWARCRTVFGRLHVFVGDGCASRARGMMSTPLELARWPNTGWAGTTRPSAGIARRSGVWPIMPLALGQATAVARSLRGEIGIPPEESRSSSR